MAGLKLTFLGSPQVAHNGDPLDIGASKALALLAYLAVTGQAHSRDALGTLLWPDNDQSRARTYLRHALWSLKKEIGETWLHISREHIGFQADDNVWLDVTEFRENITAVSTHNHTIGQLCPDCLAHLQEAVSLYRDNFLTGFTLTDAPAFDEWQFFQTEELRQMLAGALEQLVAEYTVRQEYDLAITYARRWLSLDPLHEPVHRTLMKLYASAGQQAAAMRQYEECVRLLDEELGIVPEAETSTLYEAIRTRQFNTPKAADAEPIALLSEAARFVMEDLLATGAHGEVYRGQDVQTGEPVIIKRLRPDSIKKDKKLVARFLQEAEALRQLNHPNIVRLLATFELKGQQHLVMEYAPAGSLAQRLQQQPQMPLNEALNIALELADALSRAHHLNIIHRDVKPENVLLADDGTPRLTDFGVARLLKKDGRLTEKGVMLGSPAYMSPEMLQGNEPDKRSDIWSFGVLLFEMLAGQRPFPGEQITAVMISILNDPTPDIRQIRPEVPEALANLLQHMLVKDLAGRIASMRLAAAQLEAVRSGIQSGTAAESTSGIGLGQPTLPEAFSELPAQSVIFVGRESEQDDLKRSLKNPVCRLLTITGPGGIGKTRLAMTLAATSRPWFPDGVFFVSLTPLQSTEDIVTALGNSFGLQFGKEDALLPQLLRYLRHKHLLLVLDNFEHLLQGASVVAAILGAAPKIKIVATSRERLVLSSEVVYPLAGLSFPDQEHLEETDARSYSAVQLLLQRAAAVRQNLEPDAQSLSHIVRICQLVGGMPLALVLAASWLDMLSFEEVANEISQNLDFLAAEMGDVPERQRSMRAVFDTSWKRLTADEQQILMGLTVFWGGFVREAAQTVTSSGPRILRKLVNKSLLVVNEYGRFDMHELLRQYIQEKLQTSPTIAHHTKSQHASYYVSFLSSLDGRLRSEQQQEALAMLEAELENIRAVWHWLVQQTQWETIIYQVLPALFCYCELRFKAAYLWPLLEEAQKKLLEAEGADTNQHLFALLTAKSAFFYTGVTNRLKIDNEPRIGERETVLAAWQLRESVSDQRNLRWQILLAFFYGQLVNPEEGIVALLDLLPELRQGTQTWELGLALQNLGQLYLLTKEQRAESYLTEALDIFQRIGDAYESSITQYLFGMLFVQRQQLTEAQTNFLLVQQNFSREDDFAIFALVNWELADVFIGLGKPESAFECLRQSYRMFLDRGMLRSALSFLSRESYESLRYGTIDHALETREECLALVAEADDPLGEPWYIWEMGEIYRVKGDLDQARQWYERAFVVFKKTQDRYDATFFHQGMAFYHHGLGNIALAQNKVEEAREHLQESLNMAEASGHKWIKAYALADLGRATLLLGDTDTAQQYLVKALKQTKQIANGGMAMIALAGVALLYTIQERWDDANELGAFVLNHPLAWQETRSQVAALLVDEISASNGQAVNGQEANWLWLDVVNQKIDLLQLASS